MSTGSHQRGFSYLFVLMLIALIGLGLGAAGTLWRTESQREREAELLFIGAQYQQAIARYYAFKPEAPRLPTSIDALLEDSRSTPPARHLRRPWRDPFGGTLRLILAEDGSGIIGVASTSTRAPLKTSGFARGLESFERAASHADWQFIFLPPALPADKPQQAQ